MKLVQAFVCAVTLLGGGMFMSQAMAETCFNCGSGSSGGCQQCRGDRKHCEKSGCKITGTGSCSTAANVKVCSLDDNRSTTEVVAWTTVSSIN